MTQKLLFPILLKTRESSRAGAKLPSLYYEVAANGVFQVRQAKTHRAVTRATHDVPGLLEEREFLELFFPRLPRPLIENVLAFFCEVHRRWQGEAIVILFYHAKSETFEVGVPPQTIGSYRDAYGRVFTDHHLDYGTVERPSGCIRLGTIHSHGDLPAYASHTDQEDERYGDGLHVVFGSLTSQTISRSATFVANGRRFPLDPDDILEDAGTRARAAPAAWLDRVVYIEPHARQGWAISPILLYPTDYAMREAAPEPHARIGEDDSEH